MIVFESDETPCKVQRDWTAADVLAQANVFMFKDVARLLRLSPPDIKAAHERCCQRGVDPWQGVGIKKIWNHWLIRMSIFAPYYRQHLEPPYAEVLREWDGNALLCQRGVYALADVCRKIPFTANQIRNQARKGAIPGVRKVGLIWVVDMDVFGPHIANLWQSGFGR